jgi:putative PIN family toxin of toxin-antitoxin system
MSVVTQPKPIYILDTNIWLDWLIFTSDTLDDFKTAHANGEWNIIYTSPMKAEFADVISRPQFKLSMTQQKLALDGLSNLATESELSTKPLIPIRCKDKDDQIFIDMALTHHATWLLSKDKHLLTLKNRAAKQNLLIGTIDDWRKQAR